jgi:hypothetical protein
VVVSQWLRATLGFPKQEIAASRADPPQPRTERYPATELAALRTIWSNAILAEAKFPGLRHAPDLTAEDRYSRSVAPLRAEVWNQLTGGSEPAAPPMSIVRRDTVGYEGGAVVERLTLEWTSARIRVHALMAVPPTLDGSRPPLVFSTDATLGANELFGLPPSGPSEYLGAYGAQLSRNGYAVFAPIVEPEVPTLLSPVLRARDPASRGAWGFFLGLYRAALGTALLHRTIDPAKVTAYGISFGGYAALLLGALDNRVTQLVYANPANVHSTMFEFGGNEFANWLWDGHAVWDVTERYLVWPRRFIREVETSYRYEAFEFQRIAEIGEIYDLLGTGSRFRFVHQPSGHRTRVEILLPWMRERE